jgi:hypothetical protein
MQDASAASTRGGHQKVIDAVGSGRWWYELLVNNGRWELVSRVGSLIIDHCTLQGHVISTGAASRSTAGIWAVAFVPF